jgi:hypothetical protein
LPFSSSEPYAKELGDIRKVFEKASNFMEESRSCTPFGIFYIQIFFSDFQHEGDPTFSLLKYWARFEAKFCNNMEKSREIWKQIMQAGVGNQAEFWLEYVQLERWVMASSLIAYYYDASYFPGRMAITSIAKYCFARLSILLRIGLRVFVKRFCFMKVKKVESGLYSHISVFNFVLFSSGTLEDYDDAVTRCDAQLSRLKERQQKVGCFSTQSII